MKTIDKRSEKDQVKDALAKGLLEEAGDGEYQLTKAGRYRFAIAAAIEGHRTGRSYRRVIEFLETTLLLDED